MIDDMDALLVRLVKQPTLAGSIDPFHACAIGTRLQTKIAAFQYGFLGKSQ
jgi:hypothetical protein